MTTLKDQASLNCQGRVLKLDQYKGQSIAVLTSGGDSQGMNPALRAIVRTAMFCGCRIYFVKEGFTGLISGGPNIEEASWDSVSSILHRGGTFIGTARCPEFMTFDGKKEAAKNMVLNGISNLIVIGGDGSLTGANLLKQQWPELLAKLLETGEIMKEQAEKYSFLRVVGLLGTIDNDFPQTDMTIGADSALHRIDEAVYAIASTASSHKRTFIVEVMGRHCGFLALKTALTAEADYLFMPELPPPDDWPEELANKVRRSEEMGKRLHLIIVAEGATDRRSNPISSDDIRRALLEKVKLDARVTVLGHVQRGGNSSAFDRVLASMSGAEAVCTIMELKATDEPVIIGLQLNVLRKISLSACIEQLREIKEALAQGDYEKVIHLRGRGFEDNINIYRVFSKLGDFLKNEEEPQIRRNFAILLIGSPAGGMNACIYALVRMILYKGGKVLGIQGGVEGLMLGNFVELKWSDVNGLMFEGGAYLGTKRFVPADDLYHLAAHNLGKFNVDALIVIGGFEAFVTAYNFTKRRDQHPEFCIPIVVIPATSNNNVPGTDFTIGADTGLNAIVRGSYEVDEPIRTAKSRLMKKYYPHNATHLITGPHIIYFGWWAQTNDLFRQSAMGTTGRVFVVETQGGRCGYLCSVGALASGADASYIYEEPFGIVDLIYHVKAVLTKMNHGSASRGLIMKNECCNDHYDTDFMTRLYAEEGKNSFTARKNVLGHIQQGYLPSSFDRSLAVKMSVKSSKYIFDLLAKVSGEKVHLTSPESAVIIGLQDQKGYVFNTIESVLPDADFQNRFGKKKWWLRLRPLTKMLTEHYMVYRKYNTEKEKNKEDNC